ncbi:MAG: NAD-dependent epimerase/dehydratase family protein [Akkermansiaceae bacterium]
MARLLIAGYGFLGTAIEQAFSNAGWVVDKLSRSGHDQSIACDISAADEVQALTGEYDLVINCAASGGGGEDGYRRVYLEGCRNLTARFSDTHFIFTSSTSVYNQMDHSSVDEESDASPTSATGKVLREAEEVVLAAAGTVARLSGLYGPGRCHVLKNLLKGTAHLDGKGERIMNFIHRDDVARALLLISQLGSSTQGEIYNVTADPVSQYDCYASLAAHFNKPIPPSADASLPRKRGNSSKAVENTKLKALGWNPHYEDFLSIALSQDGT